MLKAFKETELPQDDADKREQYKTTVTNCQAILMICMQLEQLMKQKETVKESSKIHLRVLELLVLNDEAADIALLNGRLQQTLNDMILLHTLPQSLDHSDVQFY